MRHPALPHSGRCSCWCSLPSLSIPPSPLAAFLPVVSLGRAVAERLARMNADVHMLCRNRERGEAARGDIAAATGSSNVFLHVVDVSDFDDVKRFSEEFSKDIPKVDALINNAGCMPTKLTHNKAGAETGIATMIGGSYLLTGLLLPVRCCRNVSLKGL